MCVLSTHVCHTAGAKPCVNVVAVLGHAAPPFLAVDKEVPVGFGVMHPAREAHAHSNDSYRLVGALSFPVKCGDAIGVAVCVAISVAVAAGDAIAMDMVLWGGHLNRRQA